MNYYEARRRESDGKWDWTRMNDGRVWPVGFCAPKISCECVLRPPHVPADPCEHGCEGDGWVPSPDYCGSHDTAAEARTCFRRYLLAEISEVDFGDWTGCVVCDAPTKKGLTTRPPLGESHALCDEHRTHEQVEKLTPVVSQITSSY